MRIEHHITKGYSQGNEVYFTYEGKKEQLGEQPSGKMITDSDQCTFVYLFDDGEDYQYIHFSKEVWPLMQQLTNGDTDPLLACENGDIQLTGFTEELTMLVFNIEGNGNYGEQFMLAVEQEFADTLKVVEE